MEAGRQDPEKEGWCALKGWGGHATLFALAGASNMCAAAITNPVNVVKVRMQLDGALSSTQERNYPGFLKSMFRVGKEEGIKGLWRGTGAALLREASYSSIRMGAYEPLKTWFGGDDPTRSSLWIKIAAGATAGTIGGAIANPTDVIMIRMQAPFVTTNIAGVTLNHWKYKGPFQAFGSIARTEGLHGLFRGVGPTMQRAAILNAAQIPSYDHTKYALLDSGWMQEGIACHFVSSMTAGLVTAIVMSPIDLIKTRIMQQGVRTGGAGVLYSSTLDCFWKTLRSEGPRGLYKGFIPVWMRIGPHTVITFFFYEQFRRALRIKPV
ncbi:hypothetical protein BDL97_09G023400 [Sphagnum fallax]|nr:hypothetical protein BDL97_09G023400 [Sphagnum fallax]KAH8951356.1 hypothetical protein BDL97_09G023400 [Sphagnum fallax]